MSSNTASTDTPTCLTLIGPSNFQIWKLQIMAKLWREKVLGMALGTDTCQITSLSIPGTTTTVPRAHGIIQDSISNALLLKTEMHTTTKDLFNALLSIHQVSSLASTFYIFQQLFNSTWFGGSTISKHIASLCTLEACLAGMKFMVNTRLLTFVLLNSLLKTPEWNMFTSSIINTVEDSKLTFDTVETHITSEEVRLNPSGSSDSALKVFNKSSARPTNSATWCEHHQQSGPKELRKGGGKR
ncbi:hypothetical protein PAXRUDRAFT_161993 [Paxillus rubicundulus Ve08.2h10]|uniref:DUF4219 domain-containing protein n=1 Tax=Paxillus rubicundulus Ve08.2h10 TaxID=930991 RepID=A0A0D0DEA3_9AGAM|nr:hypothetical protein PAXRUDRAFT_175805 [Paxillus rubicundulus Ve08.2h10]KIK79179.1 hypothetical protein PAXRUDRAFT_161993 [Paxillus rubicundulus Ve08.2h10]